MNTIYIVLYTLYYVHYTVDESSQKMFFFAKLSFQFICWVFKANIFTKPCLRYICWSSKQIYNRLGVARAVLQTPLSLINSITDYVMLCENIF